jgi:sensor c-di-GMP phosphodiesterase-like protein
MHTGSGSQADINMIRNLKQRVLFTLVATILAATCGTLAGCLMGRFITLKLAERRLAQEALRASAESDIRLTEMHAVLSAMKVSSAPPCSAAELTYFRALIFDAKYLKDAGRMSDGMIDCSASLAHPAQPLNHAKQDVNFNGSVKAYKNLALYQMIDLSVLTLQDGDIYVVLVPYLQAHTGIRSEHYSEAVRDGLSGQTSWLLGEPPSVSASSFMRNEQVRVGNTLYATRCSTQHSNCITAYITIPEALQADHTQYCIYILLGGLTGGFLGLFCSIIYRRSRSMEQQLRRAIRKDKLRVAYQPIVDMASKRVVGAEALARWTDEDGFTVVPDVFVKIAEAHGFVGEITKLVLRRILHDFGETLRNRSDFRISINVAAADLSDPEFLPLLEQSLKQAEIPARSLVIEITESSTARHELAIETIQRLHERGHSVHIDDFGTGYSSLSYLHDLAVDAIKIDRSFTQSIGTESVTVAILPQILAMAEALNLDVTVEGIETGQQAGYFSVSKHPIFGQGWLFGYPVSTEEFHRLLTDEKQPPVE